MSYTLTTTTSQSFALIEIDSRVPLTPKEIVNVTRPKFKRDLGVVIESSKQPLLTAFLVSAYRQNDWVAIAVGDESNYYMVVKGNRAGVQPGNLFALASDGGAGYQLSWVVEEIG